MGRKNYAKEGSTYHNGKIARTTERVEEEEEDWKLYQFHFGIGIYVLVNMHRHMCVYASVRAYIYRI